MPPVPRNSPDVSVLIPAYNAEKWIDACLESVLCQTHSNIEVLLIDDASNDSTPRKIADWARRDERIRCLRNIANQGIAVSLNRGLEACGADLVARMDADDIMSRDRIEKQLKFMRDHDEVDILGSWARVIDLSGAPRSVRKMPSGNAAIRRILWANPLVHPSVMYRRKKILAIGGYEAKAHHGEDNELWFRCAAAGFRFDNLPEPLLDYRHDYESFDRYDIRSAFRDFLIGVRGSWKLGLGWYGYLGLLVPLTRRLLPPRLRKPFYNFTARFDPRQNS